MKKFISILLSAVMALSVNVAASDSQLEAFPGAEGGGKYTTGGRGGEVYVVTTLADYDPDTEEPIPGSFRDALSRDNRIIVFDVGGVIRLKDRLTVKRNNISILGQTAPGDGITIYGYETNISNSNNVIMRYLRFRPGADNVLEGDSMDAIWGRSMKDVMIDHLSCSWSTDETMSLYRAENMTVQWSVIAESLTMSGHTKGRHGYGAICGGVNTTYHHNLYANHTSRNPRFGGGTVEADDNDHIALFDFRNNVVYNWGFNTAYGGGRAQMNFINNYMKPGNGTRESVKNRLIDCGEMKPGQFYVAGNVLEGNDEITVDNSKGIYISEENYPYTTIVNKEFEMEATKQLSTESPRAAYESVLSKAGATMPKRDALDARIINTVKNNTGYFVNRHEEVGGLPYDEEVHTPDNFDKDKDGIADSWELQNGLNPNNKYDSAKIAPNGYAYIENYANSVITEPQPNPDINLTSPSNNQQFNENEEVIISVEVGEDTEKVVFYKNDSVIGEADKAPYEIKINNLTEGIYNISAKVYNNNGISTQSDAVKIIINKSTDLNGWTSVDIGSPAVQGSAALINNQLILKGSGKLQQNNDSCHFVYKVLKGDFDFVTKLEEMTPVDNHAFSGIMARNSLDPDSKDICVGLSHTKAYEWKETNTETGKTTTYYRNPFSVYLCGRITEGGIMDKLAENLDSPERAAESGVQLKNDVPFKDGLDFRGCYLRLSRHGNTFTAYYSPDGVKWEYVGTRTANMNDEIYVGVAADGNKVDNNIDNVNRAVFDKFQIN